MKDEGIVESENFGLIKKYMTISIFVLIAVFHAVSSLYAQNSALVDSLKIEWTTENEIKKRINISEVLFEELMKSDYNVVMGFAKLEISEYNALGSQKLLLYAYNHNAIVHREKGNLDSADFYCQKALSICNQNDFEREKQLTHLNISYNYFRRFLFDESLSQLFNVLDYFEKTDDKKNLAKTFNLIAWSYLRQKRIDKANEYLHKALEVNKSNNSENGLARTYTGFGILNYTKNDLNKAILFFKKALTIGQLTSNNNLNAVIYFQLSIIYQDLGNIVKAKQSLIKAMQLDEKSNNQKNLAYDYIVLGSLYLKSDSLTKAQSFTEKANKIATEINDVELVFHSFNTLALISYANKEYKKAFDYHLRSKESDSMLTVYETKDIAKIELQYKLAKQEQQYELVQQKRTYRYHLLIGGLILMLIVLILLYFIIIGKVKKHILEKKLLQEKVELKNKELATSVIYSAKTNELLISIAKQLTRIKLKIIDKESKKALGIIINDMRINVNEDIWKEFEIRFQNVHTEFYDNLSIKYPDLTVNERRLSAFLKLDMTTKEISAITLQAVTAIEMSRTRLRRKFGIQNCETSLVAFINKI